MNVLIKEIYRTYQFLEFSQDKLNLIQLINLLALYNMKSKKVGMVNKRN